MHSIRHEATSYRRLKERLAAEFPDADDQTLHDTLDGLSDLREMLGELVRSYLDDRSYATALKARVEEMQTRFKRYEDRAARKKALANEIMEFAGWRKLTEPDFTLSVTTKPPAVVVHQTDSVPEVYWLPQPAKLDRQGLLAALKTGASVPGAYLDQGGTTLSVRTK